MTTETLRIGRLSLSRIKVPVPRRLFAPLTTDSILVEAAHQPQFPCSKASRETS